MLSSSWSAAGSQNVVSTSGQSGWAEGRPTSAAATGLRGAPAPFWAPEAPCSGDGEASQSEAPWKARHSRETVERVWFFPKQGPTQHLPGDGRGHHLVFPLPAGSLHVCLHEQRASWWCPELRGGWHRLGATTGLTAGRGGRQEVTHDDAHVMGAPDRC